MYLYVTAVWAAIQYFRLPIERLLSSRSTSVSITRLSLHFDTVSFNSFARKVLEWIPQRSRAYKDTRKRRLSSYWDVGTIVVLLSFVIAQMVLVTALFKALVALYHLLSSTEVQGGVQRLFKRAPIPVSPSTPSNELLIQPFIPGLTTSLSALPTLILALSLSQIYHEFGHALCASSSSSELSIHSTGLYLFFLIFPVFYVSISPPIRQTKSNPFDDLRIASAGIWHNVWLVFVGWLAMSKESGGLGWSERAFRKSGMLRELERGVRVIVTKPQSPLSTLLIPGGTTITHLNDLELDGSATEGGGPLALFDDYLGRRVEEAEEESYENMGWCLSKELFKPLPTTAPTNYTEHQIFEGLACCEKQTAPIAAGGGGTLNHDLCFKTISMFPRSEDEPASVRFATCLDPTTSLLSPPDSSKEKVQRCLNQQSCDQPGQVCARLGHDVVRLEIEVDEGMEKKRKELVIWKGSRNELGRIVQVTDVESRYWFVPLGIDQSIAKFFSALFSLSLALGFFNLLPLPMLDGSEILSSFLKYVSTSLDSNELPTSRTSRSDEDAETGFLAHSIGLLARSRLGGLLQRRKDQIEKFLQKWTIGVGSCLVIVTIVVQIGERVL